MNSKLNKLPMKVSLSFLMTDTMVYGAAVAINASMNLLLFPILAQSFTVEEYGKIDYYLIFLTFITLLVVFGQESAVARYFFIVRSVKAKKQVVSQSLAIQILVLLLMIVFYYVSSSGYFNFDYVTDVLHANDTAFIWVVCSIPLLFLMNFCQNILKWTFNRNYFLLMSVGSAVVTTLAVICTLYFSEKSIEMVFRTIFFCRLIFASLGLFFVRQWLCSPGTKYILKLLQFAIPYGIVCVSGSLFPLFERTIVEDSFGAYQLGLYAAAAKIGMIITLPIRAFATAWGPFSLSIYRNTNYIELYNQSLRYYSIALTIMLLLILAFDELLLTFLAGAEYAAAADIAFILSFGLVIQSVGGVLSIGIDLSKRTYLRMVGNFLSISVFILSYKYLIDSIGVVGIPFSLLLGYICCFFIEFMLAQKYHYLKWELRVPIASMLLLFISFYLQGSIIAELSFFILYVFFVSIYIFRVKQKSR